jgi:hypothetical protein
MNIAEQINEPDQATKRLNRLLLALEMENTGAFNKPD